MWPGDPRWTGAQRTRHLLQNSQPPPSAAPPVSELTSGTAATDERRTPASGVAEKWKGNTTSVETSLTHPRWSKPKMQTNQKPKTLKQRFFIDFLAPFLHDQLPETTLLRVPLPFQVQNWMLAAWFLSCPHPGRCTATEGGQSWGTKGPNSAVSGGVTIAPALQAWREGEESHLLGYFQVGACVLRAWPIAKMLEF